MPVTAVIGSQWGDEGKGKIVDFLAQEMDVVVRFSGGPNAGHTIINDKGEFKLHLVPSGIFNPSCECIIGNGVAVDLDILIAEMNELRSKGVSLEKLKISSRAHLILPQHILLDIAQEQRRGQKEIGTTRRGIGPVFADKAARTGLRVGDLREPDYFREHFLQNYLEKKAILEKVYRQETIWQKFLHRFGARRDELGPAQALLEKYFDIYQKQIFPYICDTEEILWGAIDSEADILLEGAQGTLLDIDFGTYPNVTSSSCNIAGASQGSGIPPSKINRVIGVVKAYTTRVGSKGQPFPTEMQEEEGNTLRELAHEYGATTGRPRRLGWLDLMLLRYAHRINNFTYLALTRLDNLSHLAKIPVCVGYVSKGRLSFNLADVEPIYVELPGWQKPIEGCRDFNDLPPEAKNYVEFIEERIAPINLISTGPRREDRIVR